MNALFKVESIVIETERLILRKWELSDLDDFFEYACIPGVGEMAGWEHHKTKEDTLNVLKDFIEEDKTFAIVYKENNKVIGSIGVEFYSSSDKLTEFNDYFGRELGFVLSKDYWNKGLMTEAIKALIDYLFNKLNYDFLLCGYFSKNVQSKKVQEKCGFKPYRKLTFKTRFNTQEEGVLNLLLNPEKDIKLIFTNTKTLIYEK